MRCLIRGAFAAVLLWVGGLAAGQRLVAQTPLTNGLAAPPLPVFQPPTEFFRGLLRMTPDELGRFLTNKAPELRGRVEAKITEYQAMTPEARESRLHATELHEYLQHFIATQLTNREAQLATVPAEYRKEVADRLTKFDLLPPPLKQEAMATESTARFFLGGPVAAPKPPPMPPPPLPPDPLRSLKVLSPQDRTELFASFDHFFDLSAAEREKIIVAIPATERGKVAKTLGQIQQLPREQREQSLQALSTLAAMTDQQRQLFFNSAERWNAMSPSERETWLKVLGHLPPALPVPPPPRGALRTSNGATLSAVTNPGN